MTQENPYRWDGETPTVALQHQENDLEVHVLAGKAVRFVGGRGMGKSVALRRLERKLMSLCETTVLRLAGPPLGASTAAEHFQCVADALGAPGATSMEDVLDIFDGRRLVLLLDEVDQYLSAGGGPVKAWLNHLESARKAYPGRLGVVVAGGIGILHLGHVLGSGLVSRAETVVALPFTADEVRALARPLRDMRDLDETNLDTLFAVSGGNPALVTYGLQRLWEEPDINAGVVVQREFGEFPYRFGEFIRSVRNGVSMGGTNDAPTRMLDVIRNHAGSVRRTELVAACRGSELDVYQALEILRAAGLVRLHGSVANDPLRVSAIASIITLSSHGSDEANPRSRLVSDVLSILGEFHRYSVDFRTRNGVVEEKVISGLLAIAITMRGWKCEREPNQAAGKLDLRVTLPEAGTSAHALIEVKFWGRNDYRNVQQQVSAYAVDETRFAVVVMVRTGACDEQWASEYEEECLGAADRVRQAERNNVVAHWRLQGAELETDHILVRLAER